MNKFFKVISTIIIITILLTYNVSMADNKTELQKEKSNLANEINEAEKNLKNIEKEKSQTLLQVESLISQITDYQSEINDLEDEISGLQKTISQLEKQIEEDEEKYKKQKNNLNERLITLYENGETTYLDVLLSSNSLTDFISNYYIVSELTNYDIEMLQAIEDEKNKIENEKKENEDKKQKLNSAKISKEAKASALEIAKKEKQIKAKELSEEEKTTQKEIEEMKEDSLEIDKKLKKIAQEEAEAARKAAELAAKKAKEETNKKSSSSSSSNDMNTVVSSSSGAGYIFPVMGLSKANIRSKIFPSYAGHTGVDVNINVTGKKVVAVKSGTVVISTAKKDSNGNYRSYGEYVVINHHDGTMTLYAHMLSGSRTVSENQKVSQGQVIGTVGSTGNSTGNHLHFEVRLNGKIVNPLPYLP